MRESIGEHRKIIVALRASEAARAKLEMEAHIRNTARCAGWSRKAVLHGEQSDRSYGTAIRP